MTPTLAALQRNTAPFLDYTDPVVSTIYNAIDQALARASADYAQALVDIGILGATGSALDTDAARFGIVRLSGETDDSLLTRLAAILQPRTTPVSLLYQLNLIGQQATFYEPSGGSLVAWDPTWAFHYDRATVTPTYTRSGTATGPNGAEAAANNPTWLQQSNGTYWASVWQATTQLLNNTDFSNVTDGAPTGYTESLLDGDTMTVTTDASYPIQPDAVVEWAKDPPSTTLTFSTETLPSTFTSPAITVSASTAYALSVYVNTSALAGGAISIAAVDTSAGTTTVVGSVGASTGYTRLYGTYTTTGTATTLQLQLQFPSGASGTVYFGSPQIEALTVATEYIRNSATSGTVSRATETLTYPSSVVPVWGQGTIGVAFEVTQATQNSTDGACILGVNETIYLRWLGNATNAWQAEILDSERDGNVIQLPGALSIGSHYFILRWHEGLGVMDLWLDGAQVESVTGTIHAPSVASTLCVGTEDTTGHQPYNGYIGNLTIANAWLDDATISTWAADVRTPIYAPTLLQANYEDESLASTTGGTEFGVAYYFPISLAGSSALGTNPFVLDVSGLDNGYGLQGPSIASASPFSNSSSYLIQSLAGGADAQPWTPGALQ